ncbi:MAG: TonB-dependent receptor, partial [Methylophagaceae bacterium]
APAGVGGAPTSPDLNLIPGVMIERVENLFDGASTVYGSDAVAGVANVILKKDVEGFIFDASYRQPKGEGGEETVLSGMWGKTMDNGFITVGVEYSEQKSQSLAGNPFVKGCEERIWEAEDGSIVTRNSGYGPVASGEDSCDIFPLTNRISVPSFFGSVYYTPDFTNTGIPNFSESTVPSSLEGFLPSWVAGDFDGDGINDGVFVDGNGDGFRDVDFQDPLYAFQQSDYYKSGDYRSKNERISLMLNGEYNFQDDNDTTFYYEGLYASRKSPIFSPGAQIFQQVAASNPYNPCGTNGIDCFGVLGVGPGGPEAVQPIINIRGDRDQTEVEVSQYRLVTGVTGNLGMFENIGLDNWYYDASVSYSASKGTDHRVGIDEERLINSLETAVLNDDGTVTCGTGSDGCVPVNLFADS